MPTNIKGEEFEVPEAPVAAPLPPGVKETDPAAFAQRREEREAIYRWWIRQMVDWCALHEHCARVPCRRAHACRSPTVECHEEYKAILKELIYPHFREAAKAGGREHGLM